MAQTQYITLGGERWDTIAQKAYGDPMKFQLIIGANPSVALLAVLPPGLALNVPIDDAPIDVPQALLPPWKQGVSVGEQVAKVVAPAFLNLPSSPGGGSFDKSFD